MEKTKAIKLYLVNFTLRFYFIKLLIASYGKTALIYQNRKLLPKVKPRLPVAPGSFRRQTTWLQLSSQFHDMITLG